MNFSRQKRKFLPFCLAGSAELHIFAPQNNFNGVESLRQESHG